MSTLLLLLTPTVDLGYVVNADGETVPLYEDNHIGEAQGQLLPFYQDQTWCDLIAIIGERAQMLESVILSCIGGFFLSSARDYFLEVLSENKGVEGDSWTDLECKRLTRARIVVNQSKGRYIDAARIVHLVAQTSEIKLLRTGPATLWIDFIVSAPLSADLRQELVRYLVNDELPDGGIPAGVGYSVTEGCAPAFTFDTDGLGFDAGKLGHVLAVVEAT